MNQPSRNKSWADSRTMRIRYALHALILSLIVAGCGAQSRAVNTAQEIGISKLRADLVALRASPLAAQHGISEAAWPASVRRLQPLAVQRHMGGVLIVLSRGGREQEGLLVMPDLKDDPGGGGSGASYSSLGEGMFWCIEKLRAPYIPTDEGTNR